VAPNTTNNLTGTSSELVNDGFGINQTVYLLAKALHAPFAAKMLA